MIARRDSGKLLPARRNDFSGVSGQNLVTWSIFQDSLFAFENDAFIGIPPA